MSYTPSIGVVGPSYWRYVSSVISRRLDQACRGENMNPDDVLSCAIDGALSFFKSVLEAVGNGVPKKLVASLNNYNIAAGILDDLHTVSTSDRQKVKDAIERYANFLESIRTQGAVGESDRELARELRNFFRRLIVLGDEQAYEEAIQIDPSFEIYARLRTCPL